MFKKTVSGTGACAVYPLLAAADKKWHMAATESDADSLAMAQANIERNNLQSFITGVLEN